VRVRRLHIEERGAMLRAMQNGLPDAASGGNQSSGEGVMGKRVRKPLSAKGKSKAAQATARYRVKHPDRVTASKKRCYPTWLAYLRVRRANPDTWAKAAISQIRHRAKTKGLECTITAADISPPLICPVLGIKLRFGGRIGNDSPSVDRFENSSGYIPGNVRVISWRANNLKRDATIEELQSVIVYMRGECVF